MGEKERIMKKLNVIENLAEICDTTMPDEVFFLKGELEAALHSGTLKMSEYNEINKKLQDVIKNFSSKCVCKSGKS